MEDTRKISGKHQGKANMLKCFWAEIALLEESEAFAHWFEKVTMQRREKVLRCKNKKDKQRSLLSGVLLRKALETEGFSYVELEFSTTPEGKPVVLSHPQVHFSLSHAGDYVCCLVGDTPVGVDIESLEKTIFTSEKAHRLSAMAKKCLSDSEGQAFEHCSDLDKPNRFLEYWTKKEAYSKFTGKGLGMEFSSIDTEEKRYWTEWISDTCCISIYEEDEHYEDLCISQITSL